jgi:hypothetical protein
VVEKGGLSERASIYHTSAIPKAIFLTSLITLGSRVESVRIMLGVSMGGLLSLIE